MSGRTLEITLSEKLDAAIEDAVMAGDYASANDVVLDVMERWRAERLDENGGYTLEELRALVQEGIDSGPGGVFSADEIKAEGRRRLGRG